uniref:Uncharacterized protein n=1 Tax=Arundo donax TaxID=35708 RepID=A0A0A9G4E4_ARUDO
MVSIRITRAQFGLTVLYLQVSLPVWHFRKDIFN